MKLILDKNNLRESPAQLLRQAGYAYLVDRNTGQESFVRGFGRGYYPRFHLYLVEQNGRLILNLHLDQKQASYAGARAHNAEYDGETVEAEMARIKRFIVNESGPAIFTAGKNFNSEGILDRIRPKHFEGTAKKEVKPSWWKFWK
ncbi:MAG: hypothetical protein Q7K35_00320 [bacterium]|nr:hypothetical protein [bacterium]